ncbi:MAG: FAD-dependent oxidoreductase [Candidatus Lokiarchaeota archaeon]|nr:FAD-dependent oxidoreductase [Candidatus Lokiarchaeota archaeon]
MNHDCDFCIIGAGTAGLTAATLAARKGYKVTILEKGNIAGPLPRGESMAYYPLVDEILGEGFLQDIATVKPSYRRYHSPGDKKTTLVNVHVPYYFFEWREFIDRFVQSASEAGVEIRYNCEVQSALMNEMEICTGVSYTDESGKDQKIQARVVLACDGYYSTIGSSLGVDYSKINCPIVKFRGKNANIDIQKTPNPQFWLIPNGDLEYAPLFPPCAAYVFPIGGNNIEAGVMLRMGQVPKIKSAELPSDEVIMQVWRRLKEEYPGFSEVFKEIEVEYEALTGMPNASLVESFVLGNGGVVIIGDAAGFVDANGSSGLYYGMKMAEEWVNILDIFLKKNGVWNVVASRNLENQFRNTKIFKHIKKSYSLIGISEAFLFRLLATGKAINRWWWLFSIMIKSAS